MELRNTDVIDNLEDAICEIAELRSQLLSCLCATNLNGSIENIEIENTVLKIGGAIEHPMCLYDDFQLYFELVPNDDYIDDYPELSFRQDVGLYLTQENEVRAFYFEVDLIEMLKNFDKQCVFDFILRGDVGDYQNETSFGKYRLIGSWKVLKKYHFRDGDFDIRIEKYNTDQLKVAKVNHDPLFKLKHAILFIYHKIFKSSE